MIWVSLLSQGRDLVEQRLVTHRLGDPAEGQPVDGGFFGEQVELAQIAQQQQPALGPAPKQTDAVVLRELGLRLVHVVEQPSDLVYRSTFSTLTATL
jgi:hypothetical protein